jgi:serine/threonine protein phosphatase PrpC
MSRSFGDTVAGKLGVTAIPEIKEMQLQREDKMIVIASDGVWEFMSNEEVAAVVFPYHARGNAEKASEALVKAAIQKWKSKETYSIDDITCVIVFISI